MTGARPNSSVDRRRARPRCSASATRPSSATTRRRCGHPAALTGRWGAVATGVLTLVHGDYRLDNLMFPEAGAGVVAVDWQTLAVGPPGRDLGYFLATSLHVDDRRAHQDALVPSTSTSVRRLGVADCTVEQCIDEYRLGVLQAPMITMIGAAYATAERSASADAMFLAMATRACAADPRPRLVRLGRIVVARSAVSCPGTHARGGGCGDRCGRMMRSSGRAHRRSREDHAET